MNATKRKFNALLQGIGSRPAGAVPTDETSTSSDAAAAAPSAAPSATPTRPEPISVTYTPSTQPSVLARAASTASTTSTSKAASASLSAAASLELLAKRRRVINETIRVNDATGNAVVKPSPSGSILRKWGSAAASGPGDSNTAKPATPAPAPRYCPSDREQLLRRLATFQELTDWTPKPDRINEIEWAKRGWVCQGKERLRCTLCSKELVVRLVRGGDKDKNNKDNDKKEEQKDVVAPLPSPVDTTEAALVERYAELIEEAHQDDCLWQRKGCDDSLLRLPLASPRQALADLRQRYDELCARKDFLPYEFSLRLPAGLTIDAVLETLPADFFTSPAADKATATPSPSSPNRVALALAVMGWQGLTNSRIGAVPNSASCHACLRRLGLWMFKSKQVDEATGTVLEAAPMDHLDAVREHRFFCPWKNGAIQRNPGGDHRSGSSSKAKSADTPGWELLVQVLKNDAYLRNRLLPAGGRSTAAAPADGVHAEPATPKRRPAAASAAAATTPSATSIATPGTGSKSVFGRDSEADAEDEAARDAKDKERWARLRRVKSLFDTKKSKRGGSRPNTGHSVRPESQLGEKQA